MRMTIPQLGMSYWIQSIPTLLYFINGEERARIVGTASKDALLAKLESFISETNRRHNANQQQK
jgi:thioredoxin-like negative regulator of GroEL